MKDHHKDIEQLLKVAEKAIKGDDFMFLRKLNPPLVLELAKINNDLELAGVASKAHGKRITSDEFIKFIEACAPSKIAADCRNALAIQQEAEIKKSAQIEAKKNKRSL